MKVLLRIDVDGLGRTGDIVEVASRVVARGYRVLPLQSGVLSSSWCHLRLVYYKGCSS